MNLKTPPTSRLYSKKLISCSAAQFALGFAPTSCMEHVRDSRSPLPVGPVVLLSWLISMRMTR